MSAAKPKGQQFRSVKLSLRVQVRNVSLAFAELTFKMLHGTEPHEQQEE